MHELFHYVRLIPYSSAARNNIWSSPDFFLTSKNGDSEEHAILLASFFIGCSLTKNVKLLKKRLEMENLKKLKNAKVNRYLDQFKN